MLGRLLEHLAGGVRRHWVTVRPRVGVEVASEDDSEPVFVECSHYVSQFRVGIDVPLHISGLGEISRPHNEGAALALQLHAVPHCVLPHAHDAGLQPARIDERSHALDWPTPTLRRPALRASIPAPPPAVQLRLAAIGVRLRHSPIHCPLVVQKLLERDFLVANAPSVPEHQH